jgi:hypothetical protein
MLPRTRAVLTIVLIILTIAVLFVRRPDQFLHPYIWVEDGLYTLRFVLRDGWLTILEPLAGYLLVASKIVSYVAFKTSILWAPQIEIVSTVVLTCAVVVAVARSPTHLRWPFCCALAILFIPIDSEVFAVGAYAFWWAGILVLLALLWDTARGLHWLRWGFVVFGGLSSPLAVTLLPLFLLRAAVERRQREYVVSALAIVVAIAQLLAMYQQKMSVSVESISLRLVPIGLEKFVGTFVYNGGPSLVIGITGAALLSLVAWIARARLDRYFVLLAAAFGVICISVSVRMPIESLAVIDPFVVGPRYFFYPFILLAWMMIWLAAVSSVQARTGIGIAFACSVLFSWHGLTRRHDAVDWRAHVQACASQSGEYAIPIHYIGQAKEMWHAKFTGDECRALLRNSLF